MSCKLSSQLTENTEFPHRKDQPRIVFQDTTNVYTDNHTDIKHSYIRWEKTLVTFTVKEIGISLTNAI